METKTTTTLGRKTMATMRRKGPLTGRWLAPDPMAEKYPGLSPFVYCAGEPVNRVDIDGRRDTTYRVGIDRGYSPDPSTSTIAGVVPNIDVYNCHSFAWEESNGDIEDMRNDPEYPRWDKNPDNNMADFDQLDPNTPNQIGDRVLYYVDENQDGEYNQGEPTVHSAVVWEVNEQGYTTLVISKMGQWGISINHPQASGFYDRETNSLFSRKTSRAYFRHKTNNPPRIIVPNSAVEWASY